MLINLELLPEFTSDLVCSHCYTDNQSEQRNHIMTPEERTELIAKYASGYDEVMKALDGFPVDSLGAHPIPGKWSAREIVHHLGDSESFSAARLRKLLIEDNAVIQGYDQ